MIDFLCINCKLLLGFLHFKRQTALRVLVMMLRVACALPSYRSSSLTVSSLLWNVKCGIQHERELELRTRACLLRVCQSCLGCCINLQTCWYGLEKLKLLINSTHVIKRLHGCTSYPTLQNWADSRNDTQEYWRQMNRNKSRGRTEKHTHIYKHCVT